MIHPSIPAEMPGIELESDRIAPSRVVMHSRPSAAEQASAARMYTVLDAPREDGAATR